MDIDYKNLFFVSIANGFMCATSNADICSRAIIQILTNDWKPKSKSEYKKNIQNVVLAGNALPGKFELELRKEGFNF